MLMPIVFLVIFMGAIVTPGLIALHIEDRRAAKAKGEKAI